MRRELIDLVSEGRQPRTNASLAQLLDKHLESSQVQQREKETRQSYITKHIVPVIGDRPVSAVTVEVLEAFYAELRRCRDHCGLPTAVAESLRSRVRPAGHMCRPLSAGTVRHIHYLISGAFESDPVGLVVDEPDPAGDQAGRSRAGSAAADHGSGRGVGGRGVADWVRPFVWLAMTTGARRGELCALRWRNLQTLHAMRDTHDCTDAGCRWQLVVRRAICQGHGGRIWESDTKTHQRRHIALDPETVAILVELRDRCDRDAATAGTRLTGDSYIFSTDAGGTTPPKPSTVSQRYDRCAVRLGIDTTLKNLRHYSATELITAGSTFARSPAGLAIPAGGVTTLRVYAAWMSAADQHASAALMNRMPQRPVVLDETTRAQVEPRWPHEQVAAVLHDAWQRGDLLAGASSSHKMTDDASALTPSTLAYRYTIVLICRAGSWVRGAAARRAISSFVKASTRPDGTPLRLMG